MHGTKIKEWKPIKSNVDKFFEKYKDIYLHMTTKEKMTKN